MTAHWEIVRTDAEQPWHIRFRAGNGKVVVSSENYSRRDSAMKAIVSLATAFGALEETGWVESIRDVDERDPNKCECGHPRKWHRSFVGCTTVNGNGFCECSRDGRDE